MKNSIYLFYHRCLKATSDEVQHIFFCCCLCICVIPKNPLPNPRSQRFTPMFSSSKSFTVLAFTFRYFIFFNVCMWYEVKTQLHSLHVNVQLSQHLVEKTTECFWHPYQKSIDHKCGHLSPDYQFYSVIYPYIRITPLIIVAL